MKNILLLITILVVTACGKAKEIVMQPSTTLDPKYVEVEKGERAIDPLISEQWNLERVQSQEVWEKFNTSSTLTVMMIGSGIDYNHEDLQANIKVTFDGVKKTVGKDLVDMDDMAYDHFGHDTKLAGILAGVHNNGKGIRGIVKNVSIYPVRYIDENGRSNVILLHSALQTVIDQSPNLVLLNLVNLKFDEEMDGVRQDEALRGVLKQIEAKNIPIILGAGNFGSDINGASQIRKVFAEFNNVVIVTGLDKEMKKPMLANYSMGNVMTSAPSEEIMTTVKGGGYAKSEGTDLAAAHVAGAMAYAISEFSATKKMDHMISALLASEASNDNPNMNAYSLGRNSLNINKYLNFLSK